MNDETCGVYARNAHGHKERCGAPVTWRDGLTGYCETHKYRARSNGARPFDLERNAEADVRNAETIT